MRSAKKRPHTDPAMWSFARSLVLEDPELAEKFNFGVLDFARKICTVRSLTAIPTQQKTYAATSLGLG